MSRLIRTAGRGLRRVTDGPLAVYQTALLRIGISLTWLLFLLREAPHRHGLYGPDGPWNTSLARQLVADNGAFTALLWREGRLWFEIGYLAAVASSALLLLGWRTRTMSVLFMVGVLSLQNRSVFVGDGGDNVLHLMSLYLVLTRCGRVWSLDARRERRAAAARGRGRRVPDRIGPALWGTFGCALLGATIGDRLGGDPMVPVALWTVWTAQGWWWVVGHVERFREPRVLLDLIADVVHNGALLVIAAEVCLIYATAGWYKIQGSRWQDGTAVHYPLNLEYFSPWPSLAAFLASSATLVMVVSYGTVIAQVAFPFALFDRRLKNPLLVFMVVEHLAIGVVLGLPFFSMAMIASDSFFLPTSFLRRVAGRLGRPRERLRRRVVRSVRGRRGEAPDEPPVGFPA
ncbi:HTTM domain-containing protein [Streptomyces sp. ZYX-F-203]